MRDYVPPSEPQEASASLESPDLSAQPQQSTQKRRQTPPQTQNNPNNESAIAEFPPETKKTTCSDKCTSCNNSSPPTESSQTLAPESTSNVKASAPFWSSRPREWCQKLWLPTGIGSADSPLTSSNGSFNSIKSNSWFSIKAWGTAPPGSPNSQKTSWPSLTFSIAESMVKENTEAAPKERKKGGIKKSDKPLPTRTRKVRLHPNAEVTQILRRWFGSVRKTYNWALATAKAEGFLPTNVPNMRKRFVTADAVPDNLKFLLDTPKHVRDGALDDLSAAYKSNLEKRKINPDHRFQVAFRSKKETQSIVIPYAAIKLLVEGQERVMSMYPRMLCNKIKYHVRSRDVRRGKAVGEILYDCRLTLDKLGRFHLCVPQYVPACDNQASSGAAAESDDSREEWGSLDPGVKTFQTVYCPTPGVAFKIGDQDVSRMYRLGRWLDKLISRRASLKGATGPKAKRQRKRLGRALVRAWDRLKHLVQEVHWKTAHFLVTRFKRIIIPPFKVQDMVTRGPRRRINSVTVRKMLQWSHYAFRMRLMQKAVQHNCTVYVCGEEYTSKACTSCMQIHEKLGGNRNFKCPHCGIRYDRDVGGSRNIFLKNTLLTQVA